MSNLAGNMLIHAVAKLIAENQGGKSVALATGSLLAQDWKDVRTAAGVFGYPTVEEVEKGLHQLLYKTTSAVSKERTALAKAMVLLTAVSATADDNAVPSAYQDVLTLRAAVGRALVEIRKGLDV
jgi:alanine dehydrogenase